jgi:hypothetical protein
MTLKGLLHGKGRIDHDNEDIYHRIDKAIDYKNVAIERKYLMKKAKNC